MWQQIIANFINVVLVLVVVELIKMALPILKEKVSWLLPIIAAAIGPAVSLIQGYLGGLIGLPIDLSPIVAIFTGGSASALYDVFRNLGKK